MKKKLRWIGLALLSPFLLIALLAIALYLPPVQQWAVKQVTAYASKQTGMQISVDRVRLRFPLDLGVEGIKVIKRNESMPQVKDTVADIKTLVVNVQLRPLFHKQVMVDELSFRQMKLNTSTFIHEARIEGDIEEMKVKSHGIDLAKETVRVNDALLDGARLLVALNDTVPPDTSTSEPTRWKIMVDNLLLKSSRVAVRMPGDTMRIGVSMTDARANDTHIDLYKGLYKVRRLEWNGGGLTYDNVYAVNAAKGLDPNHLALNGIHLRVDSLSYHASCLSLALRQCAFREQSGIELTKLTGALKMDSTTLELPLLQLRTSESSLSAKIAMDLNAFDEKAPGELRAVLHASLGKQDIMRLAGDMPDEFHKHWPNYPLAVDGSVKGNMKRATLTGLKLNLPTAVRMEAKGWLADVTDMDRLRADIDVDMKTYQLGFVPAMLSPGLEKTVRVPDNIHLSGNVTAKGSTYGAQLAMKEGSGEVRLKGSLDTKRMAYDVDLSANALQITHFLPGQELQPFTGELKAKGVGTDIFSPRTRLKAQASIRKFGMGIYNLGGIQGDVDMANGKMALHVDGDNDLMKGALALQGFTDNRKQLQATMEANIGKIDLYNLKLTKEPMALALCGHIDVATNYKDYYMVRGLLSDLGIYYEDNRYHPEAFELDLLTRKDTTHVAMNSGDFNLSLDGKGSYEQLLSQGNKFVDELLAQLKNRKIDQAVLRAKFPSMRMKLNAGRNNLLSRTLGWYGYTIKNAEIDLASSPKVGMGGHITIDSLVAGGFLIDTIRSRVLTIRDTTRYQILVANNKHNPQYVFRSYTMGEVFERGSNILTQLYDAKGRLGMKLGLVAVMEPNGSRVSLIDRNPVIGYKTFTANERNYIYLGSDQRVYADMVLAAEDGTGIQLYSDNDNTEALQDLTLSLGKIELGDVLSVIPYLPDITGTLDGDFHVIQTQDAFSLSSNFTVDEMTYEGARLGDVGSEFVYMPLADGTHTVDGILMADGKEVSTVTGSYLSEGDGYMDVTMSMERMPLQFFNAFLPRKLLGLRGYGEGSLEVKGSMSQPEVNGEVFLDSGYVASPTYGVQMRFADDPVRIVNSHLLFENFEMYSDNGSPLIIAGELDFSNLDDMAMDIRMRAENFQIINAKKSRYAEAYGKAFVNFTGMMRGPVSRLNMFGSLGVLGSTDMTYVLKESELVTDNQLDELVKFTDFRDTAEMVVKLPPLEGFNMSLSMHIDESAHIICGLNADLSNYIDLMGGGDLLMTYGTANGLQLSGRYTLSNGVMKYSLPVIPLKTFSIEDGSYIEFMGDPMNPNLNITATELIKANVDDGSGVGRSVDFHCGVKLTQNLNKPGIQFIISAPDDMALQDELNTMDNEERGKIAITMLASGMYMASGSTSSFSMNKALTSFLNSEINNIMGSAMRSIGLNVGMSVDNTKAAAGGTHTDYNFKFSKRLWNNRLNVSVGGQVSSGADLESGNSNDAFFDNVELEYRLDQRSSMYIKAFYDNSTYDWLEGMIGEYGAGFVWRRKLQHFRDIFRLNTNNTRKPALKEEKKDSIPQGNKTSNEQEK